MPHRSVDQIFRFMVIPQSWARWDRSSLPSKKLAETCPVPPKRDTGHNMKGNYPSGKPRPVAGELQIEDHHREGDRGGC